MGSIPGVAEFFSEEKFVYVAEVNQRRCLEKSEQWLENVDQTHLALASGKPVLTKNLSVSCFSLVVLFKFNCV